MTEDIDAGSDSDTSVVYLDRRLVRGSIVLLTIGGIVWLAGAIAGAAAALGAGRRYVATREEPPAVTARRALARARAASMAGVGAGYGAWQGHDGSGRTKDRAAQQSDT